MILSGLKRSATFRAYRRMAAMETSGRPNRFIETKGAVFRTMRTLYRIRRTESLLRIDDAILANVNLAAQVADDVDRVPDRVLQFRAVGGFQVVLDLHLHDRAKVVDLQRHGLAV